LSPGLDGGLLAGLDEGAGSLSPGPDGGLLAGSDEGAGSLAGEALHPPLGPRDPDEGAGSLAGVESGAGVLAGPDSGAAVGLLVELGAGLLAEAEFGAELSPPLVCAALRRKSPERMTPRLFAGTLESYETPAPM
jgi:hypothetical protein